MTDEIWVIKQSTMLKLSSEIRLIERDHELNLGIMTRAMFMPKMVVVPDHYLITNAIVGGYSKREIMKRFYPYRSKKKRLREKWFKRHGRKHL